MTNNLHQLSPERLDWDTILNTVGYFPAMYGIGVQPKGWVQQLWARGDRDIATLNLDDKQVQQTGIQDTVFNELNSSVSKETFDVRPYVFMYKESMWKTRNVEQMIPQIMTHLNKAYDQLNYETLKSRFTGQEKEIDCKCSVDFINTIMSVISKQTPLSMEKIVIIDPETQHLVRKIYTVNDSSVNWLETFRSHLKESNATLRVCQVAPPGEVFICVRQLIHEYQGVFPHVRNRGHNEETDTEWTKFAFSISDFAVAPGVKDAILKLKVKDIDQEDTEKACDRVPSKKK